MGSWGGMGYWDGTAQRAFLQAHLGLWNPLGWAALQQHLVLQGDLLAQRLLIKVLPQVWMGKEKPGVTSLQQEQGSLQNFGGGLSTKHPRVRKCLWHRQPGQNVPWEEGAEEP